MARKFSNGIDLQNQRAQAFASPAVGTDGANKNYVDAKVAGLAWKDEVIAATTGALPAVTYANGTGGVGATLTANANGAFAALDSQTTSPAGGGTQRYLVKNQPSALQNGIYTLTTLGTGGTPFVLTRTDDADATADINNATVVVTEGTVNGGLSYTQTTKNPVIGTDNIAFAQYAAGQSYTASLGVTLSGNDFRLASGVAGAGLTLTSGVIDVAPLDSSLTANANDLSVNLNTTGGLETSSGIRVKLADGTLTRAAGGMSVTQPLLKYTNANIGDGSTTAIVVTHGLGTKLVMVAVFDNSTFDEITCDVNRNSTTQVTLTFAVAPTTNQYTVVVMG